jgi:D-threo-aldose 1-dehydrogenase
MEGLKNINTVIINSAVFNGGFLTGGDYYNYKLVEANNKEHKDLLQWRKDFFVVCDQFNIQPAHACVQFGLKAPGVTSIALNTTKAAKVKGNIDMATIEIPGSFWGTLRERQLI